MRSALALLLSVAALAGCEKDPTPANTAPATAQAQAQSLIACAPKQPAAPTAAANAGAAVLTMDTDRGTIQARLDRAKTACTIAILTALAKSATYDGKECQRLEVLRCLGPNMGHEQELENLPSPLPPSPIALPTVCEGKRTGGSSSFRARPSSRPPRRGHGRSTPRGRWR